MYLVDSFKGMQKSQRIVFYAFSSVVAIIVLFVLFSAFAPVESNKKTNTEELAQRIAAQDKPLRAQSVGKVSSTGANNSDDPELSAALKASESRRMEQEKSGAGSYVPDKDIKTWKSSASAGEESSGRQAIDGEPSPGKSGIYAANNDDPYEVQDQESTRADSGSKVAAVSNNGAKAVTKTYLSLTQDKLQEVEANRNKAVSDAWNMFIAGTSVVEGMSVNFDDEENADAGTTGSSSQKTATGRLASNRSSSRNNGSTSLDASNSNGGTQTGAITTPGFVPGDSLLGTTDQEINSDVSSKITFSVITPPFERAIVTATIKRIDGYVVMTTDYFTWGRKTAKLNALVMDPGVVASTAFSSETDRHIMLRYGMLFTSGFLSGMGDMAEAAISDVSVNGDTVINNTDAKAKDYVIAGLGNVGDQLSQVSKDIFNTPPTVHVYAKTRIGLVVMEPTEIPWLPAPYVIEK